jgi:signal transduction histidine kinase
MFDNSGLALQLKPQTSAFDRVHLLFLTDRSFDLEEIDRVLLSAGIKFTYEIATVDRSNWQFSLSSYDAIVYEYHNSSSIAAGEDLKFNRSPIEALGWWQNYLSKIPFILITDPLGDEIAIDCVRSGIAGYILRPKLSELPKVLKSVIPEFSGSKSPEKFVASQKPGKLNTQQLEKIRHQQQQIEELQAAQAEWEKQAAMYQESISHLNHELRNSITLIIGFAKMLKEQIYGSLNPKQLQYATAINSAGEMMLDLVNKYLTLAKIDAEKEEIYPEKLLVEDICHVTLSLNEEKAKDTGLQLILQIDDDVDFCIADKLSLRQILTNLLSNAIKFTQKGSVTLKVSKTMTMLEFAVIDTGMGISAENMHKLFQPFQQLNNRHEGSGLGLALSHKLAQLHGGDIKVASELGKGTCFTLQIPLFDNIPND